MIARLRGTLLSRSEGLVEVETAGGVVYEVEVPLPLAERLPREGAPLELRTVQVVREDSVTLFGFLDAHERELFKRLMLASGVGPRLALSMLSTLTAPRLVRALVEKDLAALSQVSGVGRKKAEKIALELSDRVGDLALAATPEAPSAPGMEEAVAALVALGFSFGEAERSVRRAVRDGGAEAGAEELIRRALASR